MGELQNWQRTSEDIMRLGPVVPVMVIERLDDAVPLAKALVAGGIKVLEITLRTAVALDAIRAISQEVPDAVVGAGTVANSSDLQAVIEAGGEFAISPGLTVELLEAANRGPIALIPGIATISEMMTGMDLGYDHFKFFPAQAAGGVPMLKSFAGPFPQITFCPTGGISLQNYHEYLSQPNVACVGGSWLAPKQVVADKDWEQVSKLAAAAVQSVGVV